MANLRIGRKSGFIQRSGVMRRESTWFFMPRFSVSLAASATAALVVSLNAAALALRPFTIVRTRGAWLSFSDQEAASEEYVGNIGYAVVTGQASAIGVTAVPTPATDQGSESFFVIETWPGKRQQISNIGSFELVPREFDSKAMRKVSESDDMIIVIEAGIGGAGVTIASAARVLVKLH